MLVDFPKVVVRSTSTYGALIRYTKQARRNKGKVNAEDFKDVDINQLRMALELFHQMRGPLQKIDLRWFYWMYLVMIGYCVWATYKCQRMLDERLDRTGGSLEERRRMFSDDYEEDIRPR